MALRSSAPRALLSFLQARKWLAGSAAPVELGRFSSWAEQDGSSSKQVQHPAAHSSSHVKTYLGTSIPLDVDEGDASAARSSAGPVKDTLDDPIPSLVVFGGNGYVGSHVCQEALRLGVPVTSISRSGKPESDKSPWTKQVRWMVGDATDESSYQHLLRGCMGAISCIGLISTSQADMLAINGEANVKVIETAAALDVPRMVYVSAHDYQFPGDLLVLRGYFEGKRKAEAALKAKFPENGVVLRPGFIHGVRRWGSLAIPLNVVGAPLERALKMTPSESLASIPLAGAAFVPPIDVKQLAKVAVAAATDASLPAGVMDVWQMNAYS